MEKERAAELGRGWQSNAVITVGTLALGQPQSQLGTAVATPRVWQRDSSSLQLQGVKGPQGFTLTTSLHLLF